MNWKLKRRSSVPAASLVANSNISTACFAAFQAYSYLFPCIFLGPQELEEAVIETIQAGKMTKDLAICVHGTTKVTPDQYLNTEPFMDAIAETFAAKRAKGAQANGK